MLMINDTGYLVKMVVRKLPPKTEKVHARVDEHQCLPQGFHEVADF